MVAPECPAPLAHIFPTYSRCLSSYPLATRYFLVAFLLNDWLTGSPRSGFCTFGCVVAYVCECPCVCVSVRVCVIPVRHLLLPSQTCFELSRPCNSNVPGLCGWHQLVAMRSQVRCVSRPHPEMPLHSPTPGAMLRRCDYYYH